MGGNRSGTIRKLRLKRVKRETLRLLAKHAAACEAAPEAVKAAVAKS